IGPSAIDPNSTDPPPSAFSKISTREPTMIPFAIFQNLGMPEMMIVAFLALLIFGNRLPSVMRSLGKSVTEFKKGVSGIEEDIDNAVASDTKKPNSPTDV